MIFPAAQTLPTLATFEDHADAMNTIPGFATSSSSTATSTFASYIA
jgi:hypothetical protein